MFFNFMEEDVAGPQWQHLFQQSWPRYKKWFLQDGIERRPSYKDCREALDKYMPEILPLYDHLANLSGGEDMAARFLSVWQPPAYLTGCTQLVFESENGPCLIRNYDYGPTLTQGNILSSRWLGKKVIASLDCIWGVLDGMNEDGLAVSLAFGGREQTGIGFGVPIILRYVLETCSTVDEAVATLQRIPSHMSYNIMLLDRSGVYKLVWLIPDQTAQIHEIPYTANHQDDVSWEKYLTFTNSQYRENIARDASLRGVTYQGAVDLFLSPDLFSEKYDKGYGTLYTSAYQPTTGSIGFHWKSTSVLQSFHKFDEIQNLEIEF